MAIQLIPLVAAIVGGAATIGAGTYIYKNYNEAENEKSVPVISQPVKLLDGTTQKKSDEKQQAAKPNLPKFDLLRVEKDGSVLISGSTEPNSAVEIIQDDTVLGKAKSAENGDFVVVFDNPLKPGNYELYIRSTHKDGTKTRSLEAAIVAIPQEGGELLAMVSKPSGPSKLIQVTKLDPKVEKRTIDLPKSEEVAEKKIIESAGETKTAEVQEKVAENKPLEVAKAKIEPAARKVAKLTKVEEKAKPEAIAQAEVKVAPVEKAKKVVEPKPVEVAKLETKQIEEVKIQPVEENKTTTVGEAKVEPVEIVKVVPQLRPAKETAVDKIVSTESEDKVPADVAKSEPPQPAKVKPVFLGAVEVEGKKIFVAGTGQPNHIVNIYIDDKFVGNAKVDSHGTFLMESSSTLAFGNHSVRADMLGTDNSIVVARAQVPLIHDLPEAPKEVVVAKAADANKDSKKTEVHAVEPVKSVQQETSTKETIVADGEREQSGAAVAIVPKNEDQIKQEPVKLTKSTGAEIVSAKSVEPVAEKLESTGEQLQVAKLEDSTTKKEDTAKILTRKLEKNDSKKAPEIVTPPKQEVEVEIQPATVAEKTPEPVKLVKTETDSQPVEAKKPKRVIRTSSSVIIRRGDNLWRISRRILGRGIRYSTIYQANRDQIKNPSLIFPGQIFKVPEKMVDVDTSEKS